MATIHQHAKLLLRLLPRGREGDDALHQEDGDLELALEPDCKSSTLGFLVNRETDHATYSRPVVSSPDLTRNNAASPLVAKRRPPARTPRSLSTKPSRA